MRLLSTVSDAFQLSGRTSVVVVPGVLRRGPQALRVEIGDPVVLERPDGTTQDTTIGGVEFLSPPNPDCIPVMLGPGVTKEMVPIGTKLWVRAIEG